MIAGFYNNEVVLFVYIRTGWTCGLVWHIVLISELWRQCGRSRVQFPVKDRVIPKTL